MKKEIQKLSGVFDSFVALGKRREGLFKEDSEIVYDNGFVGTENSIFCLKDQGEDLKSGDSILFRGKEYKILRILYRGHLSMEIFIKEIGVNQER